MIGLETGASAFSIEVEYLFTQFQQRYKGVNTGDYASEVNIEMRDFPILWKISSDYNGYFEFGPQFSTVKSAKYKRDNESEIDHSSYYASTEISAIIGFGTLINVYDDKLFLRIGFRFQYGLTDLKGTDALSNDLADETVFPNYNSSHTGSIAFLMGLSYDIRATKTSRR